MSERQPTTEDLARLLIQLFGRGTKPNVSLLGSGLSETGVVDLPFDNPMSAKGSIIVGGEGGTPLELVIGTLGEVLTVIESSPGVFTASWEPAASGYTDEQARDALAAALVGGDNITITVNDAGNSITIAVTGLTAADISDFDTAVEAVVGALPTGSQFRNYVYALNEDDGTWFFVDADYAGQLYPVTALFDLE